MFAFDDHQNRYYEIFICLCFLLISIAGFCQLHPPLISSITPAEAPAGAVITIAGNQFNPVAANNIVQFGAVRAAIISSSATEIKATVPFGATYKRMSVTDLATGLTGHSTHPFINTYNNPFQFGIPSNYYQPTVTFAGNNSIRIADIDCDGKPDLLTSGNGLISISRNTAVPGNTTLTPGTFAAKVDFAIIGSWYPSSFEVADVDGDGRPDVVVANYTKDSVSVYRNNSTPGSIDNSSLALPVTFATGNVPMSIAVADIDLDGKPEIITGNDTIVSVFQNNITTAVIDSNSFKTRIDFTGVSGISEYNNCFVVISDMDGDGKPDMVVNSDYRYSLTSRSVAIFRNTSEPGIIKSSSFAPPVYFEGDFGVVVGDLDKDGKPDVVVGSTEGLYVGPGIPSKGKLRVYHNQSTPGNINLAPLLIIPTNYFAYTVCLADLDGDAKPEILTANFANGFSVLRNNTEPGLLNASSFASHLEFEGGGTSLAVADVDADGIPEVFGFKGGGPGISEVAVVKIADASNKVTFSGKVFLQGAYNVGSGIMSNTLNSTGVLATSATSHPYQLSPFRYTGTEKVTPGSYEVSPDIVDWVLVELRDASTPATIIAKRAALLKRDGTLVDLNGSDTQIIFQGVSPGNYYVAIRHRNHLGIRSATALDFNSRAATYDFTTAAQKCYQSQGYSSTVQIGSVWAMRGGNANMDNISRYTGPSNDQNQIQNIKLLGSLSTVLAARYAAEDVNMDGSIKTNGPGNDSNFLLNIIFGGLLSTSYIEQL